MQNEQQPHHEHLRADGPVFVLLLGPSGVGKSSLIHNLMNQDSRFKFISPITDRPLRPGETEKVSLSPESFTELQRNNFFLIVNEVFQHRYGTPKSTIQSVLDDGHIPILDFPLERVESLDAYRDILYKIYITPPSLGSLKQRLEIDGRSSGNNRYEKGREELLGLVRNHFEHPNIDEVVINRNLDITTSILLDLINKRLSIVK